LIADCGLRIAVVKDTKMSRIQNILEKAERDGTAMRTASLARPSRPPPRR
jgi:hypothetical protein